MIAGYEMTRAALIACLVDEIGTRGTGNRPFRIGIDGRCAAGKTTLADELAAAMREAEPGVAVLRPSADGFHHPREHRYRRGEYSALGYYEDAYDYRAIIDSLLRPLSGTEFPVLCRQVAHDWRTDMPSGAAPVAVPENAVLLFEGLFLFRSELNSYWDLRILVDVDAETSLARAIERDTGIAGPQEVVEKKYRLRYEPAWQIYTAREYPASKADLIVDNNDPLNPRLTERS
jgi:uridine kinase